MDPIQGLTRIVSWSGLAELVKAIAKALLVGGVAVWVLWSERADLFALFGQPLEAGLASAGHLLVGIRIIGWTEPDFWLELA